MKSSLQSGRSGDKPFFSIVIPVFNEEKTLGTCLDSIFSAKPFVDFEVIIVDDCSTDDSLQVASRFPAKIIRQERKAGPSLARNAGAASARGSFLVFTDADCVFPPDLPANTARRLLDEKLLLLGGTYQTESVDGTLVADFHALMAHYYETRKVRPDYLAAHYLVIDRELFRRIGGFRRTRSVGRLAACEDLELSRRLAEAGFKLRIYPELAVKHYFHFGLWRSLRNSFRKSRQWVVYLQGEGRLSADTGVASFELKATAALLILVMAGLAGLIWNWWGSVTILAGLVAMAVVNREMLKFVFRRRGFFFTVWSYLYYCFPYTFFSGLGGAAALLDLSRRRGKKEGQ